MSIIGRYILREFVFYFLACLLSLVMIAVVFAALAELELLDQPDGWNRFKEAMLSGIPLLIEIITPISVLLATILTFTVLNRSSEIVAMMAAGVSVVRLIAPILGMGGLIALLAYLNQSYLAPAWGADERTSVVQSQTADISWQFYNGRLFFFSGLSKRQKTVWNARIYEFDDHHRLERIRIQENLRFAENSWQAEESRQVQFNRDQLQQVPVEPLRAEKSDFPVVFKREIRHPKYSDFGTLFTEIRIKQRGSVNYEEDLFAFYQKISGILTIFVMIMLALPFSLFTGKHSNIRFGIVVSVVFGFTFWLADQIFISLADTDVIPLEICAFAANTLFIGIALLLMRLRRV